MLWIPSYKATANHRKTFRMMKLLGISRPLAVGYMHLFWWWALDNAPHGCIADIDPDAIEAAVDWEGPVGDFVSALYASKWVDPDGHIHDWQDYGGKGQSIMENNRLRQRAYRERNGGRASKEEPITTHSDTRKKPNRTKYENKPITRYPDQKEGQNGENYTQTGPNNALRNGRGEERRGEEKILQGRLSSTDKPDTKERPIGANSSDEFGLKLKSLTTYADVRAKYPDFCEWFDRVWLLAPIRMTDTGMGTKGPKVSAAKKALQFVKEKEREDFEVATRNYARIVDNPKDFENFIRDGRSGVQLWREYVEVEHLVAPTKRGPLTEQQARINPQPSLKPVIFERRTNTHE